MFQNNFLYFAQAETPSVNAKLTKITLDSIAANRLK
jgi:hypothetical protein